MKRDDAWKMLEGNPEYTKSHMNISYFLLKRLSGFYYGLASPFQNVPYCKEENMEWTSKEMKEDGRCSLISSGSLGQKAEKAGISYGQHFIVSSEKHLPINRGGHGGLGKQRLGSSFALCGLFCRWTGKLYESGNVSVSLLGGHGTT